MGEAPVLSRNAEAVISRVEDTPLRAAIRAEITMEIPVSADERLAEEIRDLVEFKNRKAGSSKETLFMTVAVTYVLERVGKGLDRKSTRLNSSHSRASRMPSSA